MLNLSTYSDEQLLRLLNDGDQQAFSEIYERYWEKLFISAEKILQDRAAAQDAVQEVFISLWNRRSLVQIESLQPYLFQAVRFQVLKNIRSGRTDADFYKRLSIISKDILTQDPLLFKELQSLLPQIIQSLPEDQQVIFAMSREKKMTYKEIAAEREISVKTVEKKMSQALRHIRLHLEDLLLLLVIMQVLS